MSETKSPAQEFQLLLACLSPKQPDQETIRRILREDIDWTRFASKAIDHDVAELAGHTLVQVAPDLVPDDIVDAFRAMIGQTRRRNHVLLDELATILPALAVKGVEAIPFRGPILAIQAYDDLGLRMPGNLPFLIRRADHAATIATSNALGYQRQDDLTAAKFAMIQRLQGHESLFKPSLGAVAEPHTRLTPLNMAVDIDLAELYRRAQHATFHDRSMRTLAPEDTLLALAVQGGVEMWWKLKWACDVAAFIGAHPQLDWPSIVERARAQGCLRMLLLATSLARQYFNAELPYDVIVAERADAILEPMPPRIMARWRSDARVGPPGDKTLSTMRGLLHDGIARRLRYRARTALLPTPRQAAETTLPAWLSAAYVPIKLAQRWTQQKPVAAQQPTASTADAPGDGQDAKAWAMHARQLYDEKRYTEAVEACDHALSLDPALTDTARIGIHARLHACDWRRRDDDKREVANGLRAGRHMISPFFYRAICESDAENLAFAQFQARRYAVPPQPLWRGERYRHDKIRIAYLSVELHDPTTTLVAGVFEHHDKTRFETTAVALRPDDGSEMRGRIATAFDRLVHVHAMSDAQAAKLLRELEIDVVVDLKGNAGDRRTGILAQRPVPAQVNYLGYPGTMGASFMDYILADRILIPEDQQVHYSEKVVYLPNSYMPSDDRNRMAEHVPSRVEAELPETGFVFACFNHTYKIAPEVFAVWMRLLRDVEGSVLWFRSANVAAVSNLRREARAHGVAPDRLVFAPFVPNREDYFARQGLADLLLDTLPFNAHATASDALWAGLPIVTCRGDTSFARVAASLLHAVGLPELVTSSLAEYEALALALARDPARLAGISAKLARERENGVLFDTARTTRNLETAYAMMWERTQRGEAPAGFSVTER